MSPLSFLALIAAALLALPAAAAESRYTSIANKDCRFDPIGNEPGAAEDQTKRCPGIGGFTVVIGAYHTIVAIGLARSPSRKAETTWLTQAWSAGEKIEWRGNRVGKGFQPHAATVRMLVRIDDAPKQYQVLAVMKTAERSACLIAAVDIAANRDAYELARAAADAAPERACGGPPAVLGRATEAARRVAKGPE